MPSGIVLRPAEGMLPDGAIDPRKAAFVAGIDFAGETRYPAADPARALGSGRTLGARRADAPSGRPGRGTSPAGSPCGPAGPCSPLSELTAAVLIPLVSSQRLLTSFPVIVLFLMLLPVTAATA